MRGAILKNPNSVWSIPTPKTRRPVRCLGKLPVTFLAPLSKSYLHPYEAYICNLPAPKYQPAPVVNLHPPSTFTCYQPVISSAPMTHLIPTPTSTYHPQSTYHLLVPMTYK